MLKAFVGLTLAVGSMTCGTKGLAQPVTCGRGSVNEADLSQGELSLADADVIKVRLSDQDALSTVSNGRQQFPASDDDAARYGLSEKAGSHWIVSLVGGLFGKTIAGARKNFAENAPVNATYYPSTRKVVVYTILPHVEQARPFGFWVFVRVHNEVEKVTYDCGAFE